MDFLKWKVWYYDSNFIEVCSSGTNWPWINIVLNNAVLPDGTVTINLPESMIKIYDAILHQWASMSLCIDLGGIIWVCVLIYVVWFQNIKGY